MSAPQAALSSTEMQRRVQETHKAITGQFADLAKRYANLDVDAQSWTTSSATGAAAYVFVYLQHIAQRIYFKLFKTKAVHAGI